MPGPAAPAATPMNLPVKGTMDVDDIMSAMRKMSTGWGREMRTIEKRSERSNEGITKDFKQLWWKVSKAEKSYSKLYEKTLKQENEQAKHLQANWDKIGGKINHTAKAISRIQKMKLKPGVDDSEIVRLDAIIEQAKKKMQGFQDKQEAIADTKADVHEGTEDLKTKFEFDADDLAEAGEKAGETLVKPLEMFVRKDLPGLIKGSARILGAGMSMAGGGIGKMKGALDNKAAGMAPGKGADAMKGMANAMGMVSKTLKSVGPMLSMAGGLVLGLVQLFLEADAAAKDFNKEVMATNGNAQFLSKNLGSSAAAAEDMEKTLARAYDQATQFDNVKWGITKEQYSSTISALGAEGQSLSSLEKKYDESSKTVKQFGDVTRISVAYSRALGVSLQEISQMEGEMMGQMGSNLDDVVGSFEYMKSAAEEGGVATNKFFEVIRGFSTDMTYFTLRMEDLTHVMIGLGKSMSTKEAEKFLHTITGAFKGKGLGELSVDVLMGGGAKKVGGELQGQMDKKLVGLTEKMVKESGNQVDPKTLKKYMKGDRKELAKWLEEDNAGLSDDTKKAIYEAAVQQGRLSKGGLVDIASALADADPWSAMKVMEDKVQTLTGKKIEDLTDVERLAAESAAHVPDELQKQFEKMRMGTEGMKAALVNKLKKGLQLSDKEEKLVARLGGKDKAMAATAEDMWQGMEKDQQDELAGVKDTVDYTKRTAGAVTSMEDRMKILADFLMREFYSVVINIWDAITNLPGFGDKTAKMQIAVARSGNKALSVIAEGSKSSGEFMEKAFKSDPAQKMEKVLLDSGKQIADIQQKRADIEAKMADNHDAKAGAELAKTLNDLTAQEKTISDAQAKAIKSVSDNATVPRGKLEEAAKAAGIDPKTADAIKKASFYGENAAGFLKDQGFTTDQIAKTMEKLRISMTPEQFAKSLTDQAPAGPKGSAPKTIVTGGSEALTAALPDKGTAEAGDKAAIDAEKRGATPHSLYTHDTHLEKLLGSSMGDDEDAQEESEDQGGTLDDIFKALRVRGIKLDKPFLENNFKKVFRDATYDATGEALEDYYMLQSADKGAVMNALKKGVPLKGMGAALGAAAQGGVDKKTGKFVPGQDTSSALQTMAQAPTAPPHAAGGLVTGIGSDGMAQVSPAPGEGFTSIGKGERISPAGAGGGGGKQVIELVLKGDLGRIIDVRAQNVVSNHETMKTRR